MAFRRASRRQLILDQVYAEKGGVQPYVLKRLEVGHSVEDITATLTSDLQPHDLSMSVDTLYRWISGWKKQKTNAREVAV